MSKRPARKTVRSISAAACALCAGSAWAADSVVIDAVETPVTEQRESSGTRLPAGVPSLQMSTDYTSPALAIGSYRPAGAFESQGMKVGPVTVRGGIQTALGYNDN